MLHASGTGYIRQNLIRNIHIFDAISIHRPENVFALVRNRRVDHKRAPEVAPCDARLRVPRARLPRAGSTEPYAGAPRRLRPPPRTCWHVLPAASRARAVRGWPLAARPEKTRHFRQALATPSLAALITRRSAVYRKRHEGRSERREREGTRRRLFLSP